jgi:hypothetical protein
MIRTLALTCTVLVAATASAAEPSGYRQPAPDLVKLADAPPPPTALPGPDGDWVLFAESPALVALDELAQPELKLAGLRSTPSATRRAAACTTRRRASCGCRGPRRTR